MQSSTGRPQAGLPDWYHIGQGYLGVHSEDHPLRARFQELYRECRVAEPSLATLPRVLCQVQHLDDTTLIRFEDPEPLDLVGFTLALFGDRGYVEWAEPVAGWRFVGGHSPEVPVFAFSGSQALVERRSPWQSLLGNLALNRLLCRQQDMLFFHAASANIGGAGVLMMGQKGSGKTTLSLALAERGHGFLGDEIAGVRVPSMELVPMRRSISIREGPRPQAVDALVQRGTGHLRPEQFPDGSRRLRGEMASLFPAAQASEAPARAIMFLNRFSDAPRAEPFAPGREHLALLTPLGCSLWGVPRAVRIMQMLRLLSGARCFRLDLGSPESTADLVKELVEA